jgi:protein phosphatase
MLEGKMVRDFQGLFIDEMRNMFMPATSTLEVQFGQASDPGKVRSNNEDAVGSYIPNSRRKTRSHGYLFAVADGVGGLDFGEVASSTAIAVVIEEFAKAQDGTVLAGLLPRLVHCANVAVYDAALTPERRGKRLATTIVTCALRHDQAVVAHVGDSRCYLVRDGRAKALTQDHTWVNEQRKLGLISDAELSTSDSKHVLVRLLGSEMFVSADVVSATVRANDVLVLSTDGLHGAISDTAIAEIATQNTTANKIAQDLVTRARELDGSDNATAQVIRIRSVEPVGMYRGRPFRLRS